MKNTAIIIPSRLEAKRFPNKPLALIKGIPMIVHVLNRAKETKIEKVVVATPDSEIIDVVEKNGGQAIFTKILTLLVQTECMKHILKILATVQN